MTNAGWSGNNSPRRFSTRLSLKAMAPWSKPPGSANKARTYRTTVSGDRKSTRLNSSHANISYAVFCLKKKKRLNKYVPGGWRELFFLCCWAHGGSDASVGRFGFTGGKVRLVRPSYNRCIYISLQETLQ